MSWFRMIPILGGRRKDPWRTHSVRAGKAKAGLSPSLPGTYVSVLKTLSRKHAKDDAEEVKKTLRVLKHLSMESLVAGRGKLWVPQADEKGYYPIIEKVPFSMVKRALRKNTGEKIRRRAWEVVASSTEPFVPLFARRPGSLNEAQRRSLLAHAVVSLPLSPGRYPALLGKKVPGQLESAGVGGSRSVIPIHRMDPADWERGFTMRKFSLTEDLNRRMKVKLRDPVVPKANPGELMKHLKETTKLKPLKLTLEPDNVNTQDYEYYESGFRERLSELWEKAKQHLQGEVIPTVLRGATMGTAKLIKQEVYLPATTIDMVPIERVGLKKEYNPYSNLQLTGIARGLLRRLEAEDLDPRIQEAFGKKIADIAVEIAARREV